MRKWSKKWVVLLAVLVLAAGAVAWYLKGSAVDAVSYRTVPVKRGSLLASISATGTVEPEEVVDVGAQVAGQINAFGRDKNGKVVDYGSVVEEGTVLAQIDDALYAADVDLAKARVQEARAGARRAEADRGQLRAKLRQAERDWGRAEQLGPSEALAQTSYDAYQSAYEIAQANVAVGEAAVSQAREAVAQAQATLERSERNLGYCTIRSPVKGVIIDRRVNIGQTVVASLNAPSLFLIAKDLKRMQVWVAVNEADIGSIHPGQAVSFTVDAYPGEVFRGEVGKVRLNATMTQNVVTYTVEVVTDNSSGKLLPYLTANVQFELGRRNDVWLVPNAALRWSPSHAQAEPGPEAAAGGPGSPTGKEAGEASLEGQQGQSGDRSQRGVVWVREGRAVRPLEVGVGLTDGTLTEAQGEALREGLEVIVGEQARAEKASATNPFTPQFGRGNRPPGRP